MAGAGILSYRVAVAVAGIPDGEARRFFEGVGWSHPGTLSECMGGFGESVMDLVRRILLVERVMVEGG